MESRSRHGTPQLVTSGDHYWRLVHWTSLCSPTTVLTSGGHQSTYSWQVDGTHPTGKLSCINYGLTTFHFHSIKIRTSACTKKLFSWLYLFSLLIRKCLASPFTEHIQESNRLKKTNKHSSRMRTVHFGGHH